ncbi:MAG: putative PEP-binding protein, partial [Candidatus Omnitrophota bacterium]
TAEEVWREATLIKKVKELLESEFKYLREGRIVFTYLHLASPELKTLVAELLKNKVTSIAYETIITEEDGEKVTPVLRPMSIIAGRLGAYYTYPYLLHSNIREEAGIRNIHFTAEGQCLFDKIKKEYPSISGFRHTLEGKEAVVLGAGAAGEHKAKILLEMGTKVTITDIKEERLEKLRRSFIGYRNKITLINPGSDINNPPAELLNKYIQADIMGGCILVKPGAVAPQMGEELWREISKDKPKFAVDIALDQGGNFPGSYSRHYDDPVFIDAMGNLRFCVPNIPDAVGKIASIELEKTNLEYTLALAMGLEEAVRIFPELTGGVNTFNGKIVHPEVAKAYYGDKTEKSGRSSSPVEQVSCDNIVQAFMANNPNYKEHEVNLIRHSYALAEEAYVGKLFPEGDSYIIHTTSVAFGTASLGGDAINIAISLLHKAETSGLKDKFRAAEFISQEDIEAIFSTIVKLQTISLPYLGKGIDFLGTDTTLQNYPNFIVQLAEGDHRVLLHVLVDSMEAIYKVNKEGKDASARELRHIYAPLARRLLPRNDLDIKMLNLAFELSQPEEYLKTKNGINEHQAGDYDNLEQATGFMELKDSLVKEIKDEDKGDPKAEVMYRKKGLFSIFEKTKRKEKDYPVPEAIEDLNGLMVITEEPDAVISAICSYLSSRNTAYKFEPKHKRDKGYAASHINFFDIVTGSWEIMVFRSRQDYELYRFEMYGKRLSVGRLSLSHRLYKLIERLKAEKVKNEQRFDPEEIVLKDSFPVNCQRLYESLKDRIYVMVIEPAYKGRYLSVIELPVKERVAYPIDLALHSQINKDLNNYYGLSKIMFNPTAPKPFQFKNIEDVQYNERLTKGMILTFKDNPQKDISIWKRKQVSEVTLLRRYNITEFPRSKLFLEIAMGKDMDRLAEKGRKEIAKKINLSEEKNLEILDKFIKLKGFKLGLTGNILRREKDRSELYAAFALGLIKEQGIIDYCTTNLPGMKLKIYTNQDVGVKIINLLSNNGFQTRNITNQPPLGTEEGIIELNNLHYPQHMTDVDIRELLGLDLGLIDVINAIEISREAPSTSSPVRYLINLIVLWAFRKSMEKRKNLIYSDEKHDINKKMREILIRVSDHNFEAYFKFFSIKAEIDPIRVLEYPLHYLDKLVKAMPGVFDKFGKQIVKIDSALKAKEAQILVVFNLLPASIQKDLIAEYKLHSPGFLIKDREISSSPIDGKIETSPNSIKKIVSIYTAFIILLMPSYVSQRADLSVLTLESYQIAQELSFHYLERAYIRISYVLDNPNDPENVDFLEEATLFLEEARSLSPNNSKVFNYLGLIAFQKDEFSLAIRYFEKAVSLKSDHSLYFNDLGSAYYFHGDYLLALKAFNEAIRLDEGNYLAYKNRAFVLFQLRRYREAYEDIKIYIGLNLSDFIKDEFIQGLKEEIEERLGIKAGRLSISSVVLRHSVRFSSDSVSALARTAWQKGEGASSPADYSQEELYLHDELSNFTNVKQFLKEGLFVVDISMEAFIPHLKRIAQWALATGGLGYLAGETMSNYSKSGQKVVGYIPIYEHYVDQDGNYIGLDWDNEKGVVPLYAIRKGARKQLRLNVNFNGDDYSARIYQILVDGTFILGVRQPEIYYGIYPSEPGKVKQMAFLARVFIELFKYIGLAPDILRLNEPQLFFVLPAIENDINFFRKKGKESIYEKIELIVTTHTPEAAALPVYPDVSWLKHHIGADLVPDWSIRDGRLDLARRLAENPKVKVIFAVSQEHAEVTKLAVLPEFKDKILGITNGSDPRLWKSPELLQLEMETSAVTGRQLFDIGQIAKSKLNLFLLKEVGRGFADINKLLAGLVRRFVEYKEQMILFDILPFITGDKDKKYKTPWGEDCGLGMNLLVGGVGRDSKGREWVDTFKWFAEQKDMIGKLIFVNASDVDLMRMATQASDVWLSMPRSTREACGTSDNRSGFNGHLNIATKTGGAREYIVTGVNGWLMDIFENSGYSFQDVVRNFQLPDGYEEKDRIVNYYRLKSRELLARYLKEAGQLYNSYIGQNNTKWLEMMESAYKISHQKMSITRMVDEYAELFEFVRGNRKTTIAELAERFKRLETFNRYDPAMLEKSYEPVKQLAVCGEPDPALELSLPPDPDEQSSSPLGSLVNTYTSNLISVSRWNDLLALLYLPWLVGSKRLFSSGARLITVSSFQLKAKLQLYLSNIMVTKKGFFNLIRKTLLKSLITGIDTTISFHPVGVRYPVGVQGSSLLGDVAVEADQSSSPITKTDKGEAVSREITIIPAMDNGCVGFNEGRILRVSRVDLEERDILLFLRLRLMDFIYRIVDDDKITSSRIFDKIRDTKEPIKKILSKIIERLLFTGFTGLEEKGFKGGIGQVLDEGIKKELSPYSVEGKSLAVIIGDALDNPREIPFFISDSEFYHEEYDKEVKRLMYTLSELKQSFMRSVARMNRVEGMSGVYEMMLDEIIRKVNMEAKPALNDPQRRWAKAIILSIKQSQEERIRKLQEGLAAAQDEKIIFQIKKSLESFINLRHLLSDAIKDLIYSHEYYHPQIKKRIEEDLKRNAENITNVVKELIGSLEYSKDDEPQISAILKTVEKYLLKVHFYLTEGEYNYKNIVLVRAALDTIKGMDGNESIDEIESMLEHIGDTLISESVLENKNLVESGNAQDISDNHEGIILAIDFEPLPSDIEKMIRKYNPVAFITTEGTALSHFSLYAATYDKPVIILNNPEDLNLFQPLDQVLIFRNNKIVIHPDAATEEAFTKEMASEKKIEEYYLKSAERSIGKSSLVFANADQPEQVKRAMARLAQGIGLVRVENTTLFMGTVIPALNKVQDYFRQILSQSAGKKVVFRALDWQLDKIPVSLSFVNYMSRKWYLETELGRAITVMQIRALLRLQKEGFEVQELMFPMVENRED